MDVTAIALQVTLFAIFLYALNLVIRNAVLWALRKNREEVAAADTTGSPETPGVPR
jgi:ABC-type proline/glycine betaine transport system permease subunit